MHLTTKLENVKASLVFKVYRARAPPHAWSCLGCAPVEIGLAMFAHVDVVLLSGAEVRSSTHHCAKDHCAPLVVVRFVSRVWRYPLKKHAPLSFSLTLKPLSVHLRFAEPSELVSRERVRFRLLVIATCRRSPRVGTDGPWGGQSRGMRIPAHFTHLKIKDTSDMTVTHETR